MKLQEKHKKYKNRKFNYSKPYINCFVFCVPRGAEIHAAEKCDNRQKSRLLHSQAHTRKPRCLRVNASPIYGRFKYVVGQTLTRAMCERRAETNGGFCGARAFRGGVQKRAKTGRAPWWRPVGPCFPGASGARRAPRSPGPPLSFGHSRALLARLGAELCLVEVSFFSRPHFPPFSHFFLLAMQLHAGKIPRRANHVCCWGVCVHVIYRTA